MNHRGIECSIKQFKQGRWKYYFRVGRAVKTGQTKTELEAVAVERVKRRIERELRITGSPRSPG